MISINSYMNFWANMALNDNNQFKSSGLGASLLKLKQKQDAQQEEKAVEQHGPEQAVEGQENESATAKSTKKKKSRDKIYPPLSKISIRFNSDQKKLIKQLRANVEEVANEPRKIYDVTILRALIFLAETKKTSVIYRAMSIQAKYRHNEDRDPLCIPMSPELRSKLENQFEEIRKHIKELRTKERDKAKEEGTGTGKVLDSSLINNTMFFRAMLDIAVKEKPQTLYRHAIHTVI